MNSGTTSRIAACLSFALTVAFLAVLSMLHLLEPEFNTGHLISEYQLGNYGFLMSLAFCLLGASALLLALSLGPRLHTRGGRAGWWVLLFIGAAFSVAGVFPPIQTPRITAYLHGISGVVSIFGSPIAFTLIAKNLAPIKAPSLPHLHWATLVSWCGFSLFVVSLAVGSLTGQMDTPLPWWISLANRFLIVTYCIWLLAAAWGATREGPAIVQRNF